MEHDFDFDDGRDDRHAAELESLLRAAVDEILRTEDGAVFLAWARREAPALAPEMFAPLAPEVRPAAATALGLGIWNVMPLPGNGYRPRPLKPERNQPCLCGSGRKYKRCCAGVPDFPGFDEEIAWALLLERLPLDELAGQAERGRLPRAVAAEVAARLVASGGAERALDLLEPLFRRLERCDGRDAPALDFLLNAYDALGDEERKEEAIERLRAGLRPPLCSQLQRWEALDLHGRGRTKEAWEVLARSRREDPDEPRLAILEVTFLLSEDRCAEAAARARRWLPRLAEGDLPDEGLAFVRRTAADAEAAAFELCVDGADEEAGWIARLERLLARPADPAAEPYALAPLAGEGEGFQLVAPRAARGFERRWTGVFQPATRGEDFVEPSVWDGEAVEAWLGFLEARPAALGSLALLADLETAAMALREELGPAAARRLLRPLYARAREVVGRALAGRPEARLPASHPTNFLALSLLAGAAILEWKSGGARPEPDRFEELLRLDPGDRFGVFPLLLYERLRRGEDAAALELAARFPQDRAACAYGEVLALYRLGRKGEALTALDRAVARLPLAAAVLANPSARRRRPRTLEAFDAWAFLQSTGTLWAAEPELLAWLRARTKAARKRSRRRPGLGRGVEQG